MASYGKKAQSGVETFVVAIVLTLVFLYAYSLYVERNDTIRWIESMTDAQRECEKLASVINHVRTNGEGFNERVSFEEHVVKVFGNKGGIEVAFNSDLDDYPDNYYCTFLTSNVTNQTHYTFEAFGSYRVQNDGVNITFYKI